MKKSTESSRTGRTLVPRTSPKAPYVISPTSVSSSLTPKTRGSITRKPEYGLITDSDEVHDEIRDLSSRVKGVIEKKFQKNATSEEQIMQGIRRFGPSAQSKMILNRENDAAMLAMQTGIYGVWRCEEPKLSGSNNDFCTRLGYQHYCFCGHTLAEHAELKLTKDEAPPPRCLACPCRQFNYIPNTPEEIGEGWLTRRPNWDPTRWSAKCRCGHGHRQHHPRSHACEDCRCPTFQSHFLCVACDREGEAHVTLFESEAVRRRAGRVVLEAFAPLTGLDWSMRQLVLDDPTAGGRLLPPTDTLKQIEEGKEEGGKGDSSTKSLTRPEGLGGIVHLPAYCTACATIFRSVESKFCSKCGKPR